MEDARRNSIKILTRVFYDYQKERKSLDGRIGRTKNGEVKKKAPKRDMTMIMVLMRRRDDVYAMELAIAKDLATEVHKHPLWNAFLKDIKGCGETMAAVIISEFDIYRFITVSNGWSFAGMAPGKDRRVKGQKRTYNQFLKDKMLGVLGPAFLKANSPYREYYDNMRHRYESEGWGIDSKNPTVKDNPKAGHQHRAANRYMVKMFLRDLYVAWRTLEGLPVREPYAQEYLGKDHHAA